MTGHTCNRIYSGTFRKYCHCILRQSSQTNAMLPVRDGGPHFILLYFISWVNGFVNWYFAGDTTHCEPTLRYTIKLGSSPCFFGAKKLALLALFTGEVNISVSMMTCQEISWTASILCKCGSEVVDGVPLHSENHHVIAWTTGKQCPSGRAKEIVVEVCLISHLVKEILLTMRKFQANWTIWKCIGEVTVSFRRTRSNETRWTFTSSWKGFLMLKHSWVPFSSSDWSLAVKNLSFRGTIVLLSISFLKNCT